MIALIDGDLICYRCAASAENEDFEIALKELITRLHVMYPEVAKGFMDAVKETHRKAQEK